MLKKISVITLLFISSTTQPWFNNLLPKSIQEMNISNYLPSTNITQESIKAAALSTSTTVIKKALDLGSSSVNTVKNLAEQHPVIAVGVALASTSYASYKLGTYIQHKKDLHVEKVVVTEVVKKDPTTNKMSTETTTVTVKTPKTYKKKSNVSSSISKK